METYRVKLICSVLEKVQYIYNKIESLILAQDKRWRRT